MGIHHVFPLFLRLSPGPESYTLGFRIWTIYHKLNILLLQGGRIPKIVPRVLFELSSEAPPLASEAGMRVVELLDAEVKEAGLDGVVLEVRNTDAIYE